MPSESETLKQSGRVLNIIMTELMEAVAKLGYESPLEFIRTTRGDQEAVNFDRVMDVIGDYESDNQPNLEEAIPVTDSMVMIIWGELARAAKQLGYEENGLELLRASHGNEYALKVARDMTVISARFMADKEATEPNLDALNYLRYANERQAELQAELQDPNLMAWKQMWRDGFGWGFLTFIIGLLGKFVWLWIGYIGTIVVGFYFLTLALKSLIDIFLVLFKGERPIARVIFQSLEAILFGCFTFWLTRIFF